MSANQQSFVTQPTFPANNNYDSYYSNVSLLLSMNGSNGSTSFTDASLNTKTVTVSGNTQISTIQSKFGGSSAYFDGNGDWLSAVSADFQFTSDFTVEGWIYPTNVTGAFYLFAFGTETTGRYVFFINNGVLTGNYYGISSTAFGGSISINTWTHVAFVRSASIITAYVNGTALGTTETNANTLGNTGNLKIGADASSATWFIGYMDDIRITKGVARYTSNFTAPVYANPLTGSIYDPYYNNTVLLLHCNGVNGSTNFIDNSSSAKSITVNGNTSLSSSQWKFNRSSAYFDGNGDYLTVPASTDFALLGGDFTVEFWFKTNIPSDTSGSSFVCVGASAGLWQILIRNNSLTINSTPDGVTYYSYTASVTLDTNWHHFAWTKQSSTQRLFYDGVLQTATGTAPTSTANNNLYIGANFNAGTTGVNGYIDELRITKGVARYTTTFTPPKLPFPDTGIQTDPYYDQTILLLPMNGANASTRFIDSSKTAKAITVYGNTQISTAQSKFGGSSAYFDGTGDYLTLTTGEEFNFGTGDFTIECWVYVTNFTGERSIMYKYVTWSSNVDFGLRTDITTGIVRFIGGDSGAISITSNSAISTNQWVHIAVARSSNTTRMFINGVTQTSTSTGSYLIPNDATTLRIGTDDGSTSFFLGYINDIRITKGVARYIANFTAPVQPNPTTGIQYDNYYNNVSLLLRMDGSNGGTSFVDSSPRAKAITVNGNTITSTTQYKYGISSAYFDGTGDYLSVTSTTDFGFGLGDFTWEAWIYPAVITGNDRAITDFRTSAASPGTFFIDASLGNRLAFWYGSKLGGTGTVLSTNTWYHVVLTRSSGVFSCFLNGTLDWQASATVDFGSSRPLGIGAQAVGPGVEPGSSPFNGYIDDVRITKGIARYGTNGDPFYSSVSLLLHMDGANASTTFTDTSPTPKTVTANGNAQISTAQSVYGGASGLFDGSGDYLTGPITGIIDFGANNFTVEGWIRINALPAAQATILSNYGASGQRGFDVCVQGDGSISSRFTTNGSTDSFTAVGPIGAINTWHHFAIVRQGTSYISYLNGIGGTSVNVGTNSIFAPTTQAVWIGGTPDTGTGVWWFNGYIDELRITKGIARYTSNFTVPARFPDNGVNFTPPTQAVPNQGPQTDLYYSNTVLLLHCNGTNASTNFVDNSPVIKSVAANGNAQISTTQSKFGGSSAYFDGTGDYLSTPTTTDFSFGSNAFTIEAWVYIAGNSTPNSGGNRIATIINSGFPSSATPTTGWAFLILGNTTTTGTGIGLDVWISGVNITSLCSVSISQGVWHHIAVSRKNASVPMIFLNGLSQTLTTSTVTGSSNISTTISNPTLIGRQNTIAYLDELNGYIDDLRVTNGVARYINNFTPPQQAFPNFGPIPSAYPQIL